MKHFKKNHQYFGLLLGGYLLLGLGACGQNNSDPESKQLNFGDWFGGFFKGIAKATKKTVTNTKNSVKNLVVGDTTAPQDPAVDVTVSTFAKAVSSKAWDLASDGSNLYIADMDNHVIRKIVIASGEMSLVAGTAYKTDIPNPPVHDGNGSSASFFEPNGITTDGTNLYISEGMDGAARIRKVVIATGEVTTLAGTKGAGYADGEGNTAQFNNPSGLATDGINLYIADNLNNLIRVFNLSTSIVTTLAGKYIAAKNPGGSPVGGSIDGTGSEAQFLHPNGIATDGVNVYITDYNNHTIRKIVIATGVVTTVAGLAGNAGSTDGIGSAARFSNPRDIYCDGSSLFVTDDDNKNIRKISIASGAVTTISGSVGTQDQIDGKGTSAHFKGPLGIASDGMSLFVMDGATNIRKIDGALKSPITARKKISLDNIVSTLASGFSGPYDITSDGASLFVAEKRAGVIKKVVIATGEVSVLAGSGTMHESIDGRGEAALIDRPAGIASDGNNLYFTEPEMSGFIRKVVIATGEVTTIAGQKGRGYADGMGNNAQFSSPVGVATDGVNLYIADCRNNVIRAMNLVTHFVTTLAGTAKKSGSADGVGKNALFSCPYGISTDGGNLYVTEIDNHTIRKIVISTGEVTRLAGTAGSSGAANGPGNLALFNTPRGIYSDGTFLYVADSANNTIRKIVIATGAVSTIAGMHGTTDDADGKGSSAHFVSPMGITSDGLSLYVVEIGTGDTDSGLIRLIK